ncbi:MAG: NADH-quinone oxidoreductase subunit NuoH [Candidatus Magnetominusculus sp. LBB02]|nr:NADH-quinone oxidoreductase subunit NuoH [Candidatus Magnetominusculus sp. LBB02]
MIQVIPETAMFGIPQWLWAIGIIVVKIAIVLGAVMLHVAYATYFERKVIARMQNRLGPMDVGPYGLLQPIADGIKSFFKEDIIPTNSDKPLFYMAPILGLMAAFSSLAVLPFFNGFVIANINIGLLFLFAMSSLAVYGVILGGWSSNSKYSFLGGLRASAQVISYEVPLGLSLVGVMMMAGSLNITEIVNAQSRYPGGMYITAQWLGFFVFVISAIAETNRAPFDLPEAEQELIAGFFTEYSGMRFALFFMAEYTGMIVMSSLAVLCFLGGWTIPPFLLKMLPFLGAVPGVVWFMMKLYVCIFFYYWIRATLPRYRYDQLMAIGWKVLIPLSLVNIVITSIMKMWLHKGGTP